MDICVVDPMVGGTVCLVSRHMWLLCCVCCWCVDCVDVDGGAVRAILKKKSLFAAGITGVTGSFDAHSCVVLRDPAGVEIGRGVVNYTAPEIAGHNNNTNKQTTLNTTTATTTRTPRC